MGRAAVRRDAARMKSTTTVFRLAVALIGLAIGFVGVIGFIRFIRFIGFIRGGARFRAGATCRAGGGRAGAGPGGHPVRRPGRGG